MRFALGTDNLRISFAAGALYASVSFTLSCLRIGAHFWLYPEGYAQLLLEAYTWNHQAIIDIDLAKPT